MEEIVDFTLPYIIIIAGLCSVLIVAIMLWKERKSAESQTDATIAGEKMKINLTQIRWYSEMILKQDFGKLNFAQMEFLHGANDACEQAVKNLQRLLKNEDLEKTSGELKSILKKIKE